MEFLVSWLVSADVNYCRHTSSYFCRIWGKNINHKTKKTKQKKNCVYSKVSGHSTSFQPVSLFSTVSILFLVAFCK
uniref:Uncharacterized protein n=1 Tax=Anguilla anguilla TaxID=7936 RepID=A0A0E9WF43_ANGAN